MQEFNFKFPKQKKCNKCVLPESPPQINLDQEGVCNVCHSKESDHNNQPLEVDFLNILKKYKNKKSQYDCILMCSGGKDSTYALYYLVKKWQANPLVFTFDHHFENPQAIKNVKKAVKKLNTDFIFLKSNFMHEAFKEVLTQKNQTSICQLCSIWYIQEVHKLAQSYKTPLIVAGWTKGQLSTNKNTPKQEYQEMTENTANFIRNILRKKQKYKKFPLTMKEALKKSQKKYKTKIISPHWFINKDPDEYTGIIKKELDWQKPQKSYPKGSSNCLLNFLSVYKSLKDYGYTHYHIELSNLIRQGEITRKEAQEMLELNFNSKTLKRVKKKLFS